MYAVIRTGGKQYKVQAGDVLQVEKLDQPLGKEFDLNEVIMIGGESMLVGKPLVADAKVTVVVTKQEKTKKVFVFKKKRRHGYRKFATHRQNFTELFIKSITTPDGNVTTTEEQPHVIDVAAHRLEKIRAKQESRAAELEEAEVSEVSEDTVVSKPAKKITKKAATKKAVKKVTKKATTKKVRTKKTTKKK